MNTSSIPKRGLVAIVGAAAAAALLAFTPAQEGEVLKTYRDIGGVLTYCDGATENAHWGKTYTHAECQAQLEHDLASKANDISKCLPWARLTDGQRVAFTDAAYNIGAPAFCSSSMARRANAGDQSGACAALSLWINVNGRPVQGLINRRAAERAICEGRNPV